MSKMSILVFLDASKDFVTKHLAKFFIHIKKSHCGPADRGQSDNLYTADSGFQPSGGEVICPLIGARMKEASKFGRLWVDARQVCTLF
jgi:hypothetical protein